MPEGRPAIPAQLRRDVLVEAGHRCAIPTCRTVLTVQAHIIDYAVSGEHSFDNLIALCPNCHDLHTRRVIDTKALRQYKANLSVLTARYSTMEQRVLQVFADRPGTTEIHLWGNHELDVMMMVRDGLLELVNAFGRGYDGSGGTISRMEVETESDEIEKPPAYWGDWRPDLESAKWDQAVYRLTSAGLEFLAAWTRAGDLGGIDE